MSLHDAQAEYDRAALTLRREQLAEELRQRPGLSYGALNHEQGSPYLVAYGGEIRGEVFTTSPGAVLDWHARPLHGDVLPDSFHTARAAAASLIPADQTSGDNESTRG